MKRFTRRFLLSLAALSPGVVSLTVHELAMSLGVMLIGLTGVISAAIAVLAVSPKVNETLTQLEAPNTDYPSLLTRGALHALKQDERDTLNLKLRLARLLAPKSETPGFATSEDHIAMVLAQVMAQWQVTDVVQLDRDQVLELCLIERLMRADPAEAGMLAVNFTTPNAMLAMRDRVAHLAVA